MKKYLDKTNIIIIISLFLIFILSVLSFIYKLPIPAEYSISSDSEDEILLKQNDKIQVDFISRVDNLEDIKLRVKELSGNLKEDSIYISIYNYNNKLIYYNDLTKADYFDRIYFNFKFDKVKNSLNKKFKLVFDVKKATKDYKLKLAIFKDKNDSIKGTYNNKKIEGIPITEYGYTLNLFYIKLLMIIALILLFILFRHNFKNNDNLKDKLLNNKIVFIIEFIASLISSISFLKIIYVKHYLFKTSIIYCGIFTVSTIVLLFILSLYIGYKKLKREELFLLLAIPISIMYLIFMVPLKVPDELFHYRIAYRVSTFNIFNFTTTAPSIELSHLNNYGDVFNYCKMNSCSSFSSIKSGLYHPLLYMFSAIGILIARLLNFSPIIGMYIGSLVNLLIYLVIGYIAIKKVPFGKMLMLVYLLNPMFLHQATSFSVDAIINIFSMLFISYTLYIRYSKKKIDTKDFVILLATLTFVFIGKYAYFMLTLLLVLIYKEIKEYAKKNKKVFIVGLAIFLVVAGGWLAYTKILPRFEYKKQNEQVLLYDKPQKEETKLIHILNNSSSIIPIYYNTLVKLTDFYVVTFFGKTLGPLTINITTTWIIIYILILITSLWLDDNNHQSDRKNNIINFILFIVTFNIVLIGLYFGWGIITDTYIDGVQGRYFIPIGILVLLPFARKKQVLKYNNGLAIVSIILLIDHLLIIKDIITYFLV